VVPVAESLGSKYSSSVGSSDSDASSASIAVCHEDGSNECFGALPRSPGPTEQFFVGLLVSVLRGAGRRVRGTALLSVYLFTPKIPT